jgi:hypothetical protein
MQCSLAARLLFIGISNFCDDGGRMPVSPKSLRLWVFPGDDISTPDVEAMLGELASSEFGPPLIELYAGKRYLEVTGWDRSQKVEKPYYQFPDRNGVIRPDWRGRPAVSFGCRQKPTPDEIVAMVAHEQTVRAANRVADPTAPGTCVISVVG